MATRRFAALALAGALFLGACGEQPATETGAPAPKPAPSVRALGLYELHISSVKGQLSSRVTRVGGGQLSAQEVGGLTFSAAAAVNSQDATSKRYAAAITVTNGSGREIRQPLYVPVAVSGYTLNGTYYRNAQDDKGSPTDPTGVTIEQADAATPLVTTTVSPSIFSVPAGMSVTGVSPQAWQASALPSGAQRTVTFGFNIPLSSPTYSFSVVFGVTEAVPAVSHLVISQVYGGGAPYDYVELFNPTNSDVDLSTLSLQYASAVGVGTFTRTAPLAGTLKPGQHYLVGLAGSTATSTPVPDAVGGTAVASAAGKFALVNGTTALGCNGSSTPCTAAQTARIVDLVGWGTANYFEGSVGPTTSATSAIFRAADGCQDTDNNANDFTVQAPAPRNTASPSNFCQ